MNEKDLEKDLACLCNEPDFRALREQRYKFDPFKVLKVERQELRHTTTLSWLLDPQQTHGLGDSFLRSFLTEIGGDGTMPDLLISDQTALMGRVAVQPELRLGGEQLLSQVILDDEEAPRARPRVNGELDVLIESETWAVAIEAKIDSKEGEAQLHDYRSYLDQRFSGHKKLYCFYLTVHPEPDVLGKNLEWRGIQWGDQVAKALKSALLGKYGSSPEQALARCPSDERALCEFLHHYMVMLERLADALHGVADTVQVLADRHYGTLVALKEDLLRRENHRFPIFPWSTSPSWARQYWECRDVLDILIRSVRSPEASFTASVVQRMIAQAPGHMQVSYLSGEGANKATIRFVPGVWMDWQVTSGGQQTPLHALMFYHVALRRHRKDIEIKLLLPGAGNQQLQTELVRRLLAVKESHGSEYTRPKEPYLADFIEGELNTLKLYTLSLGWEVRDAELVLNDGADEKIATFWKAVNEHTDLLERLPGAHQADFWEDWVAHRAKR
ncbi:hypothetical protein GJ697_12450 [Pseudoduganella sp. FT25W]|uniref:PD-(D/E)XK nuclease family protein n=1 Tax=Duganella alba TaxID=2666081 RepID=A0A6L5QG19_9BURK|nr:PD-(D/E)XK nuclease family protein [Duganella alba]MRX08649.1 hypothetical protein [Duganella alba]MRX18211.1 hypothetical protein [Duganella alba]